MSGLDYHERNIMIVLTQTLTPVLVVVAPAFIAIVQMWYRRSEQTNRNAAWYAMLGIVNMVTTDISCSLL